MENEIKDIKTEVKTIIKELEEKVANYNVSNNGARNRNHRNAIKTLNNFKLLLNNELEVQDPDYFLYGNSNYQVSNSNEKAYLLISIAEALAYLSVGSMNKDKRIEDLIRNIEEYKELEWGF